MLERVEKLLEEAKATHHAKLHEHQEAQARLVRFQEQLSQLALQTILLEARVQTLQEVYDGMKETSDATKGSSLPSEEHSEG